MRFSDTAPAVLALLVSGLPVAAQDAYVPTLHAVSGVAADDQLNVRAEPDASAPILGGLAPGTAGVEVAALNSAGTWGRIGMGERDGWVSMRYLAAEPFPEGAVPDGLHCAGTEPFWSLRVVHGEASYSSPDAGWPAVPVAGARTPIPPGTRSFGFDAAFPAARLAGIVTARACSDGMSDRTFGWGVDILRQDGGAGASLLHGCCTLDRR